MQNEQERQSDICLVIMIELLDLWRQMHELTLKECQQCMTPYSCCRSEYCYKAIKFGREHRELELEPTEDYKNGLTNLPLIDLAKGCIAPPWSRPTCTFHVCGVQLWGCKRGDPEWTEKYNRLKERIIELEQEYYEVTRDRTPTPSLLS